MIYEFRCELTDDRLEVQQSMSEVPSIGAFITCVCPVEEVHSMQRVVSGSVNFAEVKGTGNGPIGQGLEDRVRLARKRNAAREA